MYKPVHFKMSEFSCKGKNCCGRSSPMSETLLRALDKLRDLCGCPIVVTSGFRCNTHNKVIKGAEDSLHTYGMAADIKCPGHTPEWLAVHVRKIPEFYDGGIGMYPTWVHVDVRGSLARWDMRRKK